MTEWREYRLSDIMDIISGGTPKTSVPEYWSGNIPWLSVADFNNVNRYVYDTEKHISELGLKNSSTKILKKGQLIISARGTVGALAQLKRDMAFNQSCYGLNANSLTTNDFLFYLLKYCIAELKQQSSGGVFDTIIRETFDNISVFLPPLPEQKAIADVLSSLDDKIDLLTRQNKTLEDLAQAYFRKWFIEDASDKWEEIPLGQLFVISSGKGLKKEKFTEHGQYRVLGANGEIGKTNEYLFNERLIYTGRVGTLGNVFIVDREPVWLSDNTLVFRNIKYFFFVYFSLKWANLADYNVGSTQPLIRQSDIKEIRVFMPDKERLDSFENLANSIFAKINSNQKQIQLLQKLRDTLLPKLISGEIRVKM
jgi:type I restriction enzyme S subunit